jgi:DNA-binding beta-propeller fold protein YncE
MKMKHWTILISLLLSVGSFLLSGCGKPAGELFPPLEEPRFWPPPPQTPRIQYVGQLGTEADLKQAVSSWEGIQRALFGKKEIGVLLGPLAIAVEEEKRMFVADPAASVVHLMDLESREYKQIFQIDEEERLETPVALALVQGNVYVADSGLGKVCVFDDKGGYVQSFGQDRLHRPAGLAYDSERDRLYVADAAQHTVFLFRSHGEYVSQLGKRGPGPGEFNFPTQLCTDSAGRLYVSDTLNYRVQSFTPAGSLISTFGVQGDRPGNFAHPFGIAVDTQGNIYVVDKQFENVQIFDSRGQILLAFGGEGTQPGQFWLPGGIWIDRNNRIYIADSFNKRVQVFDLLEDMKP